MNTNLSQSTQILLVFWHIWVLFLEIKQIFIKSRQCMEIVFIIILSRVLRNESFQCFSYLYRKVPYFVRVLENARAAWFLLNWLFEIWRAFSSVCWAFSLQLLGHFGLLTFQDSGLWHLTCCFLHDKHSWLTVSLDNLTPLLCGYIYPFNLRLLTNWLSRFTSNSDWRVVLKVLLPYLSILFTSKNALHYFVS